MSCTICLSPHNTFHHLGHAGVIYTVDGHIDWLCTYYGEPGRSLDQRTALPQNSLPNWEFRLCQNYVGSGVCLFLDPLPGLSVKGFLQVLHLASLSCEAVCWIDFAGVEHLISGSVILGVGDAVPFVNTLFDISSVVGEETSSMSGSKSGASIWTVSPEFMCGSQC